MLFKVAKECVIRTVCLAVGVALVGAVFIAPYIVGQNK